MQAYRGFESPPLRAALRADALRVKTTRTEHVCGLIQIHVSNSSLAVMPRHRIGAKLHESWYEINKPQNDRGAAIMASAFVEDSLGRALGKRSSFARMVEAGYERGLYQSLVRNDLHVIRNIRNAFGHVTKPITFDTPEVIQEICKLQYPRWLKTNGGPSSARAACRARIERLTPTSAKRWRMSYL